MRNLCRSGLSVLSLYVCSANLVLAAAPSITEPDDPFKVLLSVQELYDSNYIRALNKSSELITQSSLGLSVAETWSNQRLSARWQGSQFVFDKLPLSNATLQTGLLDWQSLWPKGFKSSVSFKQDGYLVDQLEFAGVDPVTQELAGVDISTQDLLLARIGYGFNDGWLFNLGARSFKQLHSNSVRDNLQYDEADGFVEVGYTTASGSSAIIRGRNGKRTYQKEALVIADINFDYTQAELETKWIVSAKTDVALLVAGYNRDGTANNESGTLASLEANWLPTEKLEFKSIFSLQHPAVGESSEGITQIQSSLLSAEWEVTTKLSLNTRLSYSRSRYFNDDPQLVRSESLINYSPLGIVYSPTTHWQLKLDSGWRKNTSPLAYRQYISGQVTAGVFFSY